MIRRAMSTSPAVPSPHGARRRGITLTEILISIMIMGIGMLSLATLFPLGLLRLRAANRATRSAYIALSATSDVSARNMLSLASFQNVPWYYNGNNVYVSPMVHDTFPGGGGNINLTRSFGPGLPIVYDPLWRAITQDYSSTDTTTRFGSGIGVLRDSTSAVGLQRITNFVASADGSLSINLNNFPKVKQIFDYNAVVETSDRDKLQRSQQRRCLPEQSEPRCTGSFPRVGHGHASQQCRHQPLAERLAILLDLHRATNRRDQSLGV